MEPTRRNFDRVTIGPCNPGDSVRGIIVALIVVAVWHPARAERGLLDCGFRDHSRVAATHEQCAGLGGRTRGPAPAYLPSGFEDILRLPHPTPLPRPGEPPPP